MVNRRKGIGNLYCGVSMEVEKVDPEELEKELEAKAAAIGLDIYYASNSDRSKNKSHNHEFGLCAKCTYFGCARSETKVLFTWCSEFRSPLSTTDPVIDCTYFSERSTTLSLREMMNIATIIDKDRRDVGFLSKDMEDVV